MQKIHLNKNKDTTTKYKNKLFSLVLPALQDLRIEMVGLLEVARRKGGKHIILLKKYKQSK